MIKKIFNKNTILIYSNCFYGYFQLYLFSAKSLISNILVSRIIILKVFLLRVFILRVLMFIILMLSNALKYTCHYFKF